MRISLRSTLAAAVLGTASLLAACGTSPVEPTAPSAAPVNSGYVIGWSAKTPQPGERVNSGYIIGWSAKDQPAPTDRLNSGYIIGWSAKDQPAPTDRVNSGYVIGWSRDGQINP